MRTLTFLICLIFASAAAFAQTAQEIKSENIKGKLLRYENFPSKNVDARNVDVWLPSDYSAKKKYAVLYMHDGQMLFDFAATWNKQEWQIDETLEKLRAEKKIRDTIVVAVWNTKRRTEEYMPNKAFEMLSAEAQTNVGNLFGMKKIQSDEYLKFLTQEVKPFIDRNYPTRRDAKNTFVMGSSMGGLISLYAISEYPNVFGGAACISTHFPAGGGVMVEYMKKYLPAPKNHKIYFDYGTATLDAAYESFQIKADEVMKEKGWTAKNWTTRKFPGDDHSEKSWAKRAAIPLEFLLGK